VKCCAGHRLHSELPRGPGYHLRRLAGAQLPSVVSSSQRAGLPPSSTTDVPSRQLCRRPPDLRHLAALSAQESLALPSRRRPDDIPIMQFGQNSAFMEYWAIFDTSSNHCYANLINKKAQLSLTNPCDAKACQKLLQFDMLTTLSLTILAYLHAFSCCYVRNLRNPEKFTENSNL